MKEIHVNQDIRLEAGYNEFVIDSDRELDLTFRGEGTCEVFLRIVHAKKMRIRTFAAANAKISYLFWNVSDSDLSVDESHEVMQDANITVAYAECNGKETDRNTYVSLREEGASALVSSASLVNSKKDYHMQVVNYAPHTYGDIKNFAVVLADGNLTIDAVCKIVKGAHSSESYQTSRALSFAEGQHAMILPELLIDEDDVQASHAMSMGSVDEDQLYYLQSRGLSVQECTSLLSTGYLMPITRILSNEELQEKLKEEMERKIFELC